MGKSGKRKTLGVPVVAVSDKDGGLDQVDGLESKTESNEAEACYVVRPEAPVSRTFSEFP